jgi:N-acetylmuramoyl-L-alanine amidase
MTRKIPYVLAALSALALATAAPVGAASNDTIKALSLSGSPFDEDFAPLPTEVQARLVLARNARVTVRVVTVDGTRVRTLIEGADLAQGRHEWSWDGRDDAAHLVPDGVYEIRARAANALGVAVARREVRKGLPEIFPANPGAIVIAVDPGHGGRYPGAVNDGYMEKDFNLDIGLKLQALLARAGVQVVMSRTTDDALDEPPTDWNGDGLFNRYDDDLLRTDSKNLARADVAVHVHNNASTTASRHGTGTYTDAHQTWTPEATELAQLVVAEEVRALRAYTSPKFVPKNNGVHFGWYYYMGPYDPPYLARPSQVTSVLSESLFVTNESELAALKRDDVRLSLAAAIYIGLARWLNERDVGIGYELVSGPASSVAAGAPVTYTIRVTNRGNANSSGWRLQLHNVPFVPVYDGSGELGSLMGSVAVPDGLAPGESVNVVVSATAPPGAGNWWVKADMKLADNSYASSAGIVALQLPLTTTGAE